MGSISTRFMVQINNLTDSRTFKLNKGSVFPVSPQINLSCFLQKILERKFICTFGCFRQTYRETDRLRADRQWCSEVRGGETVWQQIFSLHSSALDLSLAEVRNLLFFVLFFNAGIIL